MKTTITIISLSTILAGFTLVAQETPRTVGGGLAERFKQLDRNGDGKISATEFPGPQFTQMDTNADGTIGRIRAVSARFPLNRLT